MAANKVDQEKALDDALAQIHTPDFFGRALTAKILERASQQVQAGNGDRVEIDGKIIVSFNKPMSSVSESAGGCFCFRIHGVWVCWCPVE
ncbi:hypothetical protein [Kitasatospora sp. NPDC050543]|uniref:hypothetical protein n=1 Tax=Kitasatospora sp. NPDC050543 TaxID=3364054 RepID=UPI0037AAB2C0